MFDLDPKKGREQMGVRPCLVVSTDALNRSAFGTAIICPITTSERWLPPADYPAGKTLYPVGKAGYPAGKAGFPAGKLKYPAG